MTDWGFFFLLAVVLVLVCLVFWVYRLATAIYWQQVTIIEVAARVADNEAREEHERGIIRDQLADTTGRHAARLDDLRNKIEPEESVWRKDFGAG